MVRPVLFGIGWVSILILIPPPFHLVDSLPGVPLFWSLIFGLYLFFVIIMIIRSLRSGIYVNGKSLVVRKVTSSRTFGLNEVRRFYVSDSWLLRGGQCIGVELRTGRQVKCPAAACGGFDFTHYNRLIKAANKPEIDPFSRLTNENF